MNTGISGKQIEMIPIDRINILNPRVRNKKVFRDIAENMVQVGLKRPITVTPCRSGAANKDYDLVCGQGRLEAFLAVGQTEIPALVIEATEQEALVMSLVENIARRQHRGIDLLRGIGMLQEQGYDAKTIAAKIGVPLDKIYDRIRNALQQEADVVEDIAILSETPYEELPQAAISRMGMKPGQKNILVRVSLRALDRTLTTDESNTYRNRIYLALHEGEVAELAV